MSEVTAIIEEAENELRSVDGDINAFLDEDRKLEKYCAILGIMGSIRSVIEALRRIDAAAQSEEAAK